MKKLFLGAAIAVSSLTFAQQFGGKAGLNMSSLNGDRDTKSKAGFYAGLFMNAPLAEGFSIQPEVLYNNLGGKVAETTVNGTTYNSKLNLDYISVPVMFQYRATPEFYLEAGPQFGFLVNASSKADNDSNSNSTTTQIDTDNFNNFDFGAGLGLGYDISTNFGLNARYVAGFTDVDKSDNFSMKNNGFQVGAYFKF